MLTRGLYKNCSAGARTARSNACVSMTRKRVRMVRNLGGYPALSLSSQQILCLSHNRRIKCFTRHSSLLAAAVALGCVPMATNALAANNPVVMAAVVHGGGGHAMGGHPGGHAMGGHAGGHAHGGHAGWLRSWWSCRSIRRPLLRGRRTDLQQLRWLQRSRLCPATSFPSSAVLSMASLAAATDGTGGNVTVAAAFPDWSCGRCAAHFACVGGWIELSYRSRAAPRAAGVRD